MRTLSCILFVFVAGSSSPSPVKKAKKKAGESPGSFSSVAVATFILCFNGPDRRNSAAHCILTARLKAELSKCLPFSLWLSLMWDPYDEMCCVEYVVHVMPRGLYAEEEQLVAARFRQISQNMFVFFLEQTCRRGGTCLFRLRCCGRWQSCASRRPPRYRHSCCPRPSGTERTSSGQRKR